MVLLLIGLWVPLVVVTHPVLLFHLVLHCCPAYQHRLNGDEDTEYKQHLHWREIGNTLTVKIFTYHLSRTGEQLENGARKAAVAHAPNLKG